jgi:hypothetical protein
LPLVLVCRRQAALLQALSLHAAITRLDFGYNGGGALAVRAFADAAPKWQQLRSLAISHTPWCRHSPLFQALAALTGLTSLDAAKALPCSHDGDGGMVLPALTALERLDLSGNVIQYERVASAALQRLTRLDLRNTSNELPGTTAPLQLQCSALRWLSLSYYRNPADITVGVGLLLRRLTNLQHLELLGYGAADWVGLTSSLHALSLLSSLTSLALGSWPGPIEAFPDAELAALAPAVRALTGLQDLSLVGEFSVEASRQWASVWLQLPQLTSLACAMPSHSRLLEHAVPTSAPRLRALKRLALTISEAGADVPWLSAEISTLTALSALTLAGEPQEPGNVEPFCDTLLSGGISTLGQLQQLSVEKASLQGMPHAATLPLRMPALTSLTFDGCFCGADFCAELDAGHLQHLAICNTHVEQAGAADAVDDLFSNLDVQVHEQPATFALQTLDLRCFPQQQVPWSQSVLLGLLGFADRCSVRHIRASASRVGEVRRLCEEFNAEHAGQKWVDVE